MDNRHVFVTGAGSGIGEAVAMRFSKNGDTVALADIDIGRAQAAVQKISESGGKAHAVIGNIARRNDVVRMFAEAKNHAGPVDVLVNCAGIYPSNSIPDVTDEEWDMIMDINLRGTFLCSQIAINDMILRKKGWIVNLASIDGRVPGPNNSVYSASKAGVISLTRSFAAEFTSVGIRINAVAPGWVGTPNIYKTDRWKDAIKIIPVGRLAEPSEIADVINFLCSEQGYYIAGEVLNVNGGMLMN